MLFKRTTKNKFVGLLFVLPWILGFILFTAYPFIQTIKYSFNDVTVKTDGIAFEPVGLKNFSDVLFVDPQFLVQLPDYLRQVIFSVPMVIIFSLILATVLNSNIPFRRVFRAIFFLPVIIMSGPVLEKLRTSGAFELEGVSNFIVYQFVQDNLPQIMSGPILFIFNNIMLFLWFTGVPILLFLAGLQKLDKSTYEAASVDGASSWQKFWKLTLPTLKPFILLNTIFTIVNISNSSLNSIIKTIDESIFNPTKGYGFAAAMTWLYFLVTIVIILLFYLVLGRNSDKVKK